MQSGAMADIPTRGWFPLYGSGHFRRSSTIPEAEYPEKFFLHYAKALSKAYSGRLRISPEIGIEAKKLEFKVEFKQISTQRTHDLRAAAGVQSRGKFKPISDEYSSYEVVHLADDERSSEELQKLKSLTSRQCPKGSNIVEVHEPEDCGNPGCRAV